MIGRVSSVETSRTESSKLKIRSLSFRAAGGGGGRDASLPGLSDSKSELISSSFGAGFADADFFFGDMRPLSYLSIGNG
jgi:hypothetical protein